MASGSSGGPLRLILDDNSGILQYGPQEWTLLTYPQWYGGGAMYPVFAEDATDTSSTDSMGSFSLTFEGTSIAFVGNTPTLPSLQSVLITIDGNPQYQSSYGDFTPPSYMQWYQSPLLIEGTHTIVVDQIAGTSVDYAIVTAGLNSPLTGMMAIVDNDDASVQFTGDWMRNTDQFDSGSVPDGFPYRNSTHRSSTPGDTAHFRFQGTSLAIYGIFSWFNIGIISITYDLDGDVTPQTYTATTTSPEYLSYQGDSPNFLFMIYENIPAGEHTLTITVTRCINQTFILDYLTYSPSFPTLLESGNLTAPSATTTVQPTLIIPTSITTFTSIQASATLPSPGTTSASSSTTGSSEQNESMATIPGLVFIPVAIAFLLLGTIALYLWFRLRRSRMHSPQVSFVPNSNVDPPSSPVKAGARPLPALPRQVARYFHVDTSSTTVVPFPREAFVDNYRSFTIGNGQFTHSTGRWSHDSVNTPNGPRAQKARKQGFAMFSPLRRSTAPHAINVPGAPPPRRSKPPPEYSTATGDPYVFTPLLT